MSEIKITCRGCQAPSAFNNPNEHTIIINGAASPSEAPLDLELVAIWPDGTESTVQSMQVNFVDPLCDKNLFADLENLFLRADVGSKNMVSKTIGPFLDSADICGGWPV